MLAISVIAHADAYEATDFAKRRMVKTENQRTLVVDLREVTINLGRGDFVEQLAEFAADPLVGSKCPALIAGKAQSGVNRETTEKTRNVHFAAQSVTASAFQQRELAVA